MKESALDIAFSRLRLAQNALDRLKIAKSNEEFIDEWFSFLTAWKGVYTVLEQGAKSHQKSRTWFGMKKAERRKTQLLNYLFAARNDEEHGLARSVAANRITQLYRLDRPSDGTDKIQLIVNPITGLPEIRDLGDNKSTLIRENNGLNLVAVKDRSGELITPPIGMADEIVLSPIEIAYLAI